MSAEFKKTAPSEEWFNSLLMPDQSAFNQIKDFRWKEELEGWQGIEFRPGEFKAKKKTYAIAEIAQIAQLARNVDEIDDRERARFVLNTVSAEGLVFALEGMPSENKNIPGHAEMLTGGVALSAGTVTFDKDNKIAAIDNKSGHLKPDFSSLYPVLKILSDFNLLAKEVRLTKVSEGGAKENSVVVTSDQLKQLKPLKDKYAATAKVTPRFVPVTPRKPPSAKLILGAGAGVGFFAGQEADQQRNRFDQGFSLSPKSDSPLPDRQRKRKPGADSDSTFSSFPASPLKRARRFPQESELFLTSSDDFLPSPGRS